MLLISNVLIKYYILLQDLEQMCANIVDFS